MPSFCLWWVGFWYPCHAIAVAWHFSQLEKLSAWQGLFCFSPAMNDNLSFSLSYFFPFMVAFPGVAMVAFPDMVLFRWAFCSLVYPLDSAFRLGRDMNLSMITPPGTPFRSGLSIPAPGLLPTFRDAFLSSLARPLYHKIKRLIITKV